MREKAGRTMSVEGSKNGSSRWIDRQGGCQCGAIRYRLKRAPLTLYACHCRSCQKQSSSAFGISMRMERLAVEFSGAMPRIWRTSGDSGTPKLCAFCAECGTRLYHTGEKPDDPLTIKGGSLDDASDLEPICHLWMKRSQRWTKPLLDRDGGFESEPENDEILLRLWQEKMDSDSVSHSDCAGEE
ncbi:GFA family protein [Thioalkalivibrio sp. HK1]|uniref:GFA family protein n=1 Tax=Thioalkalivibrio sp. HK1 TaxID=1469245 RepID=UPI00046FFF5B|nr:GFA family protein [Thioalkalivibrio sp. HK1]